MKKYYLLILLGICFISCKNQNPLPDMQLGALTDYDIEAFDTSPRYFKDYQTYYLEGTANLSSREAVRELTRHHDRIYSLADGRLYVHHHKTGKRLHIFDSVPTSFRSFDIDTIRQRIYALDHKQIVCYDTIGNRLSTFSLKNHSKNERLAVIGNGGHLLLTTMTYPQPEIYHIDYENRKQIPLRSPNKKTEIYTDTLDAPLSIIGHSKRGTYYKYINNDTLFLVTPQGLIPMYDCHMKKASKSDFKMRLLSLDETDEYWIPRYRTSVVVKGKHYRCTEAGFITKSFQPIEIPYNFGHINPEKRGATCWIGKYPFFMSKDCRDILQINSTELDSIYFLPEELQTRKASNDLILNVLNLKDKKK